MKPFEVRGNIPFPWTSRTEGAKLLFQEEITEARQLQLYWPYFAVSQVPGGNLTGRKDAYISFVNLPDEVDAQIIVEDYDDGTTFAWANLIIEDSHTVRVDMLSNDNLLFAGLVGYDKYHQVKVYKYLPDTHMLEPLNFPFEIEEGDNIRFNFLPSDAEKARVFLYKDDPYVIDIRSIDNDFTTWEEEELSEGYISVLVKREADLGFMLAGAGLDQWPRTSIQTDDAGRIYATSDAKVYYTIGGKAIKAIEASIDEYAMNVTIPFSPSPCPQFADTLIEPSFDYSQLPIRLETVDLPSLDEVAFTTMELPLLYSDQQIKALLPIRVINSYVFGQGIIEDGDESPLTIIS